MKYLYQVSPGDPVRLDRFLESKGLFRQEEIHDLIDFGSVYVDGRVERKPSRLVSDGQQVALHVPEYGTKRFYEVDPRRILYRDPWLLAYDKENGIPCQATPYDAHNNLYAALGAYLSGKSRAPAYLGLQHRLDKDTSGVMLFSLSRRVNRALADAFRLRRVEKRYIAAVSGNPGEETWIEETPITREKGQYTCGSEGDGKEALTEFRVLQRRPGLCLVEAIPRTGRTHQIRLHLALRGLPILGDIQHKGRPYSRLMLHAQGLGLNHPVKGERLIVDAPPPEEFEKALGRLPSK
jgi:23S rRNA pseudouridine1911/1915/1917 synthase